MKLLIHTYGCQMNVRDSEAVEALMLAAGHEKAANEEEADIVIVNSCTVRQKAEEKAVGKAGNLIAAKKLTVPFSEYKTGVFTYDEECGLYMISQYGGDYVDGNTGEQVGVTNVLGLYTDVNSIKGDTAGRKEVRTTGEGKGLLLRAGTIESITWKRTSDKHTLEFYSESGQRADLSVGTTYINILDESNRASWE